MRSRDLSKSLRLNSGEPSCLRGVVVLGEERVRSGAGLAGSDRATRDSGGGGGGGGSFGSS